ARVGQRVALLADPGVQLAAEGPAREVRVALLGRRLHDLPFEPDLPAELLPVERARGPRVSVELAALARAVVRVEHDVAALLGQALQQHHARGGTAVLADRRERHRERVTAGAGRRLVEPAPDTAERLGVLAILILHGCRLDRSAQASAFA